MTIFRGTGFERSTRLKKRLAAALSRRVCTRMQVPHRARQLHAIASTVRQTAYEYLVKRSRAGRDGMDTALPSGALEW